MIAVGASPTVAGRTPGVVGASVSGRAGGVSMVGPDAWVGGSSAGPRRAAPARCSGWSAGGVVTVRGAGGSAGGVVTARGAGGSAGGVVTARGAGGSAGGAATGRGVAWSAGGAAAARWVGWPVVPNQSDAAGWPDS
ncbi:hypothetical protein GA0070624_0962 [Micromonospora rhizosphaerae]|uniref:Uncharacterized protein n=1 Tax=Micromonospora rhizosphaerae TaxID=568872 RepID=A0A1C6RGF8_9ACTN|nr:hypothetical protein GA0070624_0962 [Micromonospora rhizosphaerae]